MHVHESFRRAYTPSMSYKHVGTAADLVRFGCSLRIECTALKRAVSPGD